ncbi:hypothetical protein D3C78_1626480 [compost metagenome]
MLTRQAVIPLLFRQTRNFNNIQQPDDGQRNEQDAVIQRELPVIKHVTCQQADN